MASADFTIADKIDEARSLIEQRGWVQCAFASDDGLCVLGAFNRTDGIKIGDPLNAAAKALVLEVIGDAAPLGSIMFWNDHEGRTREEVLDVLRRAAALARARSLPNVWAAIDAYLTDIEDVARERVMG